MRVFLKEYLLTDEQRLEVKKWLNSAPEFFQDKNICTIAHTWGPSPSVGVLLKKEGAERRFDTIKEACDFLGVTRAMVYRYAASGRLGRGGWTVTLLGQKKQDAKAGKRRWQAGEASVTVGKGKWTKDMPEWAVVARPLVAIKGETGRLKFDCIAEAAEHFGVGVVEMRELVREHRKVKGWLVVDERRAVSPEEQARVWRMLSHGR